MRSRARQMLDKSLSAMLAAIEVYNKPTFEYREEAYSILAVNAWELLLKARILQIDNNKTSAIIDYEKRQLGNGKLSRKLYKKKNRTGNDVSIGLFKAYDRLTNDYADTINPVVRKNLEALTEVRDNAVHFINKEFEIRKKVHEVGTANLKNYVNIIRQWFGVSLSDFKLFLMPIAFLRDMGSAEGVLINTEERNLLAYIKSLESVVDDDVTNDFNLSLNIDIKIRRVSETSGAEVVISDGPNAIPIKLEEENIRERYPWDYDILTKRLQDRYSDFKMVSKLPPTLSVALIGRTSSSFTPSIALIALPDTLLPPACVYIPVSFAHPLHSYSQNIPSPTYASPSTSSATPETASSAYPHSSLLIPSSPLMGTSWGAPPNTDEHDQIESLPL